MAKSLTYNERKAVMSFFSKLGGFVAHFYENPPPSKIAYITHLTRGQNLGLWQCQ